MQLSLDTLRDKAKSPPVTKVVSCTWCNEEGLTWTSNNAGKRYLCDIFIKDADETEAPLPGLTPVKSNVGEIYVLKFSAHNCEVIQFARENGITRTEDDGSIRLDLAAAKAEYLSDEKLKDEAAADAMGFIEIEVDPTDPEPE